MVSLVAALVLVFLSFIASAFIILRIVIPILPPHPLSKRVSPVSSFLREAYDWLIFSIVGRIWTSYFSISLTCR